MIQGSISKIRSQNTPHLPRFLNKHEKTKKNIVDNEETKEKRWSTGVDVDAEGEDENGEDREEDEGVDEDGLPVGPHTSKVHATTGSGKLEEQARR